MLTVEEAQRICMANAPAMPAEFRRLEHAIGACLAQDAFAADDYPRMDVSAVDGYAVAGPTGPWSRIGSIAAGQVLGQSLGAGECARIFTGAAVPAGAHGVAMQEHVHIEDGAASIRTAERVAAGTNIRRRGESLRSGELLLAKGERMNAAAVGLLACGGLDEVMVVTEPVVSIVRTGSEFIEQGEDRVGMIHSSNERMLVAAIRTAWFHTEEPPFTASDDPEEIRAVLEAALADSDVVITTGGVSVGEHDSIRQVLDRMGATIHFHGVRQKPGKPMLFATVDGKPVFALPGNPRAVLVCWHAYVLPFLRSMQGALDPFAGRELLPLAQPLVLKGDRAEFRAARIRNGLVELLPEEGSHMLTTLVHADALAYFPHTANKMTQGEHVQLIPVR
jgi:molybdopterin molybdotransferase